MNPLLLVNPRSGDDAVPPDELVGEARALGVEVRVLGKGDDAAALARGARDVSALGMAGGDGSLAVVAAVAVERGIPFACIPYGTKNHFARDAGLDRDDPLGALAAFKHGVERPVDLGRVTGVDGAARPFVNGVSLGVYARLVERREHHRHRGEALARLRALLLPAADRRPRRVTVDGEPLRVRALLVSSNALATGSLSLGSRERLDGGLLHVYAVEGLLPHHWRELPARRELTLGAPGSELAAAIDGEPVQLRAPCRVELLPGALRLLVPREAAGA